MGAGLAKVVAGAGVDVGDEAPAGPDRPTDEPATKAMAATSTQRRRCIDIPLWLWSVPRSVRPVIGHRTADGHGSQGGDRTPPPPGSRTLHGDGFPEAVDRRLSRLNVPRWAR